MIVRTVQSHQITHFSLMLRFRVSIRSIGFLTIGDLETLTNPFTHQLAGNLANDHIYYLIQVHCSILFFKHFTLT